MGTWGPGSDENDSAADAIADAVEELGLDGLEGQTLADARDASFLTYDAFEDCYHLPGLVVRMLHDGFRLPQYVLSIVDELLEEENVDKDGWYDQGASRTASIAKERVLIAAALAHDGQVPEADRDPLSSKGLAETFMAKEDPEAYAAAVDEAKASMAAAAAATPPPAPFAWLDQAPTKTLRKAAVALGIGDRARGLERADVVRTLKTHPMRFKTVFMAPYAAEEKEQADDGARKAQKAA